jgi:hypothetical protein
VGIKLLGSLSRSITWKFKEEEEEERKKEKFLPKWLFSPPFSRGSKFSSRLPAQSNVKRLFSARGFPPLFRFLNDEIFSYYAGPKEYTRFGCGKKFIYYSKSEKKELCKFYILNTRVNRTIYEPLLTHTQHT